MPQPLLCHGWLVSNLVALPSHQQYVQASSGLLHCLPAYEALLEERPLRQPAWLSNTVLASRMQFLMGMLAPCVPQLQEVRPCLGIWLCFSCSLEWRPKHWGVARAGLMCCVKWSLPCCRLQSRIECAAQLYCTSSTPTPLWSPQRTCSSALLFGMYARYGTDPSAAPPGRADSVDTALPSRKSMSQGLKSARS